jgi:hypothetical protein
VPCYLRSGRFSSTLALPDLSSSVACGVFWIELVFSGDGAGCGAGLVLVGDIRDNARLAVVCSVPVASFCSKVESSNLESDS